MKADEYFNQLVETFPECTPGKMFSALCMKLPNGKAAAMFWRDFLVVKLPEAEREKALTLKGAQLFDPMDGRPMKEWVQVPFEHKSKWKELIASSVKFTKEVSAASGKSKTKSKSVVKKKTARKSPVTVSTKKAKKSSGK
jgi:hypothetical protein